VYLRNVNWKSTNTGSISRTRDIKENVEGKQYALNVRESEILIHCLPKNEQDILNEISRLFPPDKGS
jgi:hypothetical protein